MFPFTLMTEWWISMLRIILMLLVHATIAYGADIKEKVIICGVCRNVESRLEKTRLIMESIGNLFEDYRMLIYENNSADKTTKMLLSWMKDNPRVWVKSEHLSRREFKKKFINIKQDGSFFLPEQIARARNIVLEKALSPEYESFPFIIWMDMDFVLFPDLDGFVDTFNSDREWDAVFAYGIDPQKTFWDWYALRDGRYPIGSELLGMDWWYMVKELSLSKSDDWYPVYSAFGGCGIYKKASIEGCSYSGVVTRDLEIHAKKLIEEGKKEEHPQVLKFMDFCRQLDATHKIEEPIPNLPYVRNLNTGIVLQGDSDALLWRMSSFVYQYPSVCEHVPFHSSMIIRGHDKLYINPKLVFRYGG
jgi:hypothetical protein